MASKTDAASSGLAVGATVTHAEHGPGRVVQALRGGRAALVRFDRLGKLDIHVGAHEVTVIAGPPKATPRVAADDPPAQVSAVTLQLIEALRLGTVPGGGLDLYTVGREAELAAIDADLAAVRAGHGAARMVLGDYGTGKTHLLEHVAARALEQGFLVGYTALDPVDVPASNPRRVYRALVGGLRHPDATRGTGLAPLIERARGHEGVKARFLGKDPEGGLHPYLSPALRLLNRLDDLDAAPVLDWLEGAPQDYTPELNARFGLYGRNTLPALMDYRPWAHIYAHLLSGLAALAHETGHAGLVLLLDEAEFFAQLGSENREFAERLFRALMAAALPNDQLPFSPDDEPRGGRGDFKTLPYRFTGHCPLYVITALTPKTDTDAWIPTLVQRQRVSELTPLDAEHYRELARRVVDLYAARHPHLAAKREALAQLIGELMFKGLRAGSFGNPRAAVKFVIDLLDLSRHAPDRVRLVIDALKQLWY